ncbi:MAG: hypothetical protein Q4D02_01775 [Clostridia bacterium]|nr:hypothetical protein [Clostridia bacterium]
MGIIEEIILIIMCLMKMITMQVPSIAILVIIHTAIYQLTGISIYRNLKRMLIRGM